MPLILLPKTATVMPKHEPAIIEPITLDTSELTGASNPKQLAASVAHDIDCNRLSEERSRKSTSNSGTNPYSMVELREFAKILGISAHQKKELVMAIRAAIGCR
jgi:hypothetical protein